MTQKTKNGRAEPIEKEPESAAEEAEQAEVEATMEVARHADHPAIKVLGFISEISDQPPAFTLATVAGLAGFLAGKPRLTEAGLRCFAALAVATAAKSMVKASVTRTRPFMLREHGHYDRRKGGPNDGPWNSFPSGHTANAVAVARAISRVYPQARAPAFAAAAAIGAIQVPRASHYPSDVVAGAAVGFAAEALVHRLWPEESEKNEVI
ncbi:phosphatase PAP2 family protein [Paracoccus albus]|uniref:phosphatase PAP2 family protein n=1 Tax=Paracoccus albus TaxID=3017784 RepID=UPI0022F01AD5|nr:phosphatase PAP2 family protein [Paracoccus albus]WBU61458.1 phosphatase PAP2 family protein [Paracoccus albus]